MLRLGRWLARALVSRGLKRQRRVRVRSKNSDRVQKVEVRVMVRKGVSR
jgi:hypothetical protein